MRTEVPLVVARGPADLIRAVADDVRAAGKVRELTAEDAAALSLEVTL
jgi:hypothetical protein